LAQSFGSKRNIGRGRVGVTDLVWQIPLGLLPLVLAVTFVKMRGEDD
jgi:hypothetical protein